MLRNDGYILLEDPDIATEERGIPPHDSLIYLFPNPTVDARLYEWTVLVRNDAADTIFVPSHPNNDESFDLTVSANQVTVAPATPRSYEILIQLQGYLLGDHKLLKAEHSGLTSSIVYSRAAGDTTDFTALDWVLYRWRPNESREYIREDAANYTLSKVVDAVTVTLTSPVTSWISTRLLGFMPGSGISGGVFMKDEGTLVTGTPHTILNFVGVGVAVTNLDGNEATVTITGGGEKCNVDLAGTYNSLNRDFVLPEVVLHSPPAICVKVYHNSRRLPPTEYLIYESVPTVSGLDRIRFLGSSPRPTTRVYLDYVPA